MISETAVKKGQWSETSDTKHLEEHQSSISLYINQGQKAFKSQLYQPGWQKKTKHTQSVRLKGKFFILPFKLTLNLPLLQNTGTRRGLIIFFCSKDCDECFFESIRPHAENTNLSPSSILWIYSVNLNAAHFVVWLFRSFVKFAYKWYAEEHLLK